MAIFNNQAEEFAEQILLIYEEAEAEMLRRISDRLARGITSPGWATKKYAETVAMRQQLSEALRKLQAERSTLLAEGIKLGFGTGRTTAIDDITQLLGPLGMTAAHYNSAKVARILSETSLLFAKADRVILRKAGDIYTDVIGHAAAQAATGTITVDQAASKAVDQFAKRGITSFIDKAGNAWEMATYAEMATITAISNATLTGYVDTMQEYGFDLAVISSHYGACPICAAWELVIISVSGTDPRYPSLSDAESAGVFHPRCMHHISTYYEGVTKAARSSPRSVEEPSLSYAERSKQRYMERQIRQWKRRMAAALDPEVERYSYAYVRKWQFAIRSHLRLSKSVLPRKYRREGGRTLLSDAARKMKPIKIPEYVPIRR
jgi:hypothetical protein